MHWDFLSFTGKTATIQTNCSTKCVILGVSASRVWESITCISFTYITTVNAINYMSDCLGKADQVTVCGVFIYKM